MEVVYWIEMGITTILSGLIIFYYADQKAQLYAKILVFASVLCSLVCFAILPIDIYESSSSESAHLDNVQFAWFIIYYINFFMCWLVLPLAQEYEDSGEFSFAMRMKKSLVMNGVMYCILFGGVIVVIIFIVATGTFRFSQLP
jgi:hypothetical protein